MFDITKRCFRLVGGGHNKFWTVQTRGLVYFATYGRIGSHGQTQTKTFGSAYEASRYAHKMISEKTSKGYVETNVAMDAGAPPRVLDSVTREVGESIVPPTSTTPQPATTGRLTAAPDEDNQRGLDL